MMNQFSRSWQATLHPEWYQGYGRRIDRQRPFFEGWYYKLIDAAGHHKLAVIPGVFHGSDPHAFIQVLDGNSQQAWYHRYPLAAFQAAADRFAIDIDGSTFATDSINLAITQADQSVRGMLNFHNLTPWPVRLASPGIMGWYAWVPTMECYHGVLSLDHTIAGTVAIDGNIVDFSNGRGYIEKDWGQSFPSAWIWMQTNHFSTESTSLTASIAMIPWRRTRFRGFIVGLLHKGTLYRFATYTGAKTILLSVDEEQVVWQLEGKTAGGRYRLGIVAQRSESGILAGPATIDMGKRVTESLTAEITVTLTRLDGGGEMVIFADRGHHAGLEVFNVEEELLSAA